MKEYYLIVKHFGHPINNWGYQIIEVDRGDGFSENVVREERTCGNNSPTYAVQKGGWELSRITKNNK